MLAPHRECFRRFYAPGALIPLYREVLADLETPVSVYSRFADDEYAFLLESIEGGERWGRYSLIGARPHAVFTIRDGQAWLAEPPGAPRPLPGAPLEALRDLLKTARIPVGLPGLSRFNGGAVGFLGYEAVRLFERLPPPKQASPWPDACFLLSDELILFDNIRHTMRFVVCVRHSPALDADAAYDAAQVRIEALAARLTPPAQPGVTPVTQPATLEANLEPAAFEAAVARAREYIAAGDVIQTVLSQRFSGITQARPLTAYRALRLINPSPYMYLLKMGDRQIVGSSPEIMVRLTGDRAALRPIAGTRPRGATEQEDRRLADELLADEKERAEHVMLVDLGRNDLGRLAVPGSVQVRDFMTIERYSHVMHIVSHVEALLRPGADAFDLIAATFPAGTLSGAPKVRALEIIHELEPDPRGPYGGAIGYIGYDGNLDLAITIRTLLFDGPQVSVQAGAGIVADSDPRREYEETLNKARGMRHALALAEAGLDPALLDTPAP